MAFDGTFNDFAPAVCSISRWPSRIFFHDTPLKTIPNYDTKYIFNYGMIVMILAGNEINCAAVAGLIRLCIPDGK